MLQGPPAVHAAKRENVKKYHLRCHKPLLAHWCKPAISEALSQKLRFTLHFDRSFSQYLLASALFAIYAATINLMLSPMINGSTHPIKTAAQPRPVISFPYDAPKAYMTIVPANMAKTEL